jgi:formate-dependent nitrite reductase membrane component NrfD
MGIEVKLPATPAGHPADLPVTSQEKVLKLIRPQREWRWEIAVYLYLAGMGAGAYIIGSFLIWLGVSLTPSRSLVLFGVPLNLTYAALLWGPILVAIGAPFLILDLGKKHKFFTACLNPRTSWVARGFLILSAFIVLGLIVLAVSVLSPERSGSRNVLWFILEMISVIFAFATALYTGVLLKSMKYTPIWNTPLLPTLFLASALSTGSMVVVLSVMSYGLFASSGHSLLPLIHGVIRVEQIFILIEGFILAIYLWAVYRKGSQGKSSVHLLLFGDLKWLFWGGIVALGFFFPMILESLYSQLPGYPMLLVLTGLFLLCGGFFLRSGVIAAGIKEQFPMHRFVEAKIRLAVTEKKIQKGIGTVD